MTSRVAALCAWFGAHGTSCTEVLGFSTGVLNVWLVTREHLLSWPIGLLNAVFYLLVFARAGLYADTGLQVVYFVLSAIGWWRWQRGGEAGAPLRITRAHTKDWWRILAAIMSAWIALALITAQIPGAAMPWADGFLVAISLVAQWLMTRKVLEHWVLWIVANVGYIALFFVRGLMLTSVLYVIFLGLAAIGFVRWQHSWRTTQTVA
jgi:nicotinamide mononucleotide transporter